VHDLTVSAAARGYDLLVYLPTVDRDGVDVIFDDRSRMVPVQLKAKAEGGKTSFWKVRRSLLRPKEADAEVYGFEPSPSGTGRGGGVILTSVMAIGEEAVSVSYQYTDIDILSAIWMDLVPRSKPQKRVMSRLRAEMERSPGGNVKLTRSAFLPAPTPDRLLALAGLDSRADQPWRLQLRKLLGKVRMGVEPHIPEDVLRRNITNYLRDLSSSS
jgi:hypothetical protein